MKDYEYQHILTNQTKPIKRCYALLCLWLASTFYAKILGQNYFAKSNQYVLSFFCPKFVAQCISGLAFRTSPSLVS